MHRAFDSPPTNPHGQEPIKEGNPDRPKAQLAGPLNEKAKRIFIVVLSVLTVLLAIATAPKQLASPLLYSIPTTPQRAKVPGYDRHEFGRGWTTPYGTVCNTRDLVITAQGANAEELCSATPKHSPSPRHHPPEDPYSSARISTDSNIGVAIEIDHIIPLAAAWDLGAHSWDLQTRVRFANDPINLVAVSRSQNQSKSDQLPSQWLPPKRSARCWYANRVAEVASRYDLPLPEADLTAMKKQCLPNLTSFLRSLSRENLGSAAITPH